MRFHSVGIARNECVPPEGGWQRPSFPVQKSAIELPIDQKYALVFLRRAGPDSAAAQVIRKLEADKVPFPTGAPWRELRRDGYVTLEPTGHRLTPKGLHAAGDVIKDLCFRYSIHVFSITGGRGSGGGTWSRCSCGTWSTGPHNNDRFGESRIRTAQDSHIRDVTNGVWPTRTLTEHLNRVAPLHLDLNAAEKPESPGTVALTGVAAAVPGKEARDGI
jgi:hypothetical protein